MNFALLPLVQSLPPKAPAPKPTPPTWAPTARILSFRCRASADGGEPPLSNDAVSEMVDTLLKREENRALLDGLNEASVRVDRAREAMADIENREAEAARAKEYVTQLESRKLEIEESQRELLEARAMVDEAQRALSPSSDNNENSGDVSGDEEIYRDVERLESAKAAAVSAVIGTLASLPISLYQDSTYSQLALHLAFAFVSCALFGVTFRYTVRRDLDNIQLKAGTAAAFGFVRGLAALSGGKELLELDVSSIVAYSIDGAVYVSEGISMFLFASIALDFCFKTKLVSPFPIQKVK